MFIWYELKNEYNDCCLHGATQMTFFASCDLWKEQWNVNVSKLKIQRSQTRFPVELYKLLHSDMSIYIIVLTSICVLILVPFLKINLMLQFPTRVFLVKRFLYCIEEIKERSLICSNGHIGFTF